MGLSPGKGGLPVSIAYMVQPRPYRSARSSTGWSRTCSGAMYRVLPMATADPVSRDFPTACCSRAMPKSQTLTTPAGVTIRLAGLTSPWTTPAACAAAKPSHVCAAMITACATDSGPRVIRSATLRPSTSSITRYESAPSLPKSYTATMFGWVSRATMRASRSKRSTALGSIRASPAITLTATGRSKRRSRPRQTAPIPPWATSSSRT